MTFPPPWHATLADFVTRSRARYASHTAVICDGKRLTFGELGRRAACLADALRREGLARQDRVALLAQNCAEAIEISNAASLAGYIYVPLNFRLAAPELAAVIEDCAPRVIFCEPQYRATLAAALEGAAVTPMVVPLGAGSAEAPAYEAFLMQGDDVPPRDGVSEDDVAYLIYTSGSTGRPKGVMLSHRGQVASARQLALTGGVRPDSRLLVTMPLFHVGGTNQSLAYLHQGGSVVLHRRFDPRALLEDLARYRVTGLHLAPVMLRAVLDAPELDAFDLSSIETIKYASSPMPLPTLKRAIEKFGPILVQYYGLTETAGIVTALVKHEHVLAPDGEAPRHLASAGKPHALCDVAIRRTDGSAAPSGEPGRIFVRTPAVMLGYWNNAPATEEALKNGWLATGDIGFLDDDSYLYVVDREKDMVVSGGENIYSREVEEALLTHPSVAEAAVIGVPDARWGEAVAAFVVLRTDHPAPTEAELIEHCRARIASYKKPRRVAFCAALPRVQGTGKIDKQALRKPFWQAITRAVS